MYIYACIPRSFLVINVCNQGKTLCSPVFSVEDSSLSLSLDVSTVSDGEFRCFSDQNSSSWPKERRSLLREINLAMSVMKRIKGKLYHGIRRKENALCKMRKYISRKLKDL